MHERDIYDSSAMQTSAGIQPITPMTINGRGGNTAANSQQVGGEGDYAPEKKQGGFMRFLSCGCCR